LLNAVLLENLSIAKIKREAHVANSLRITKRNVCVMMQKTQTQTKKDKFVADLCAGTGAGQQQQE